MNEWDKCMSHSSSVFSVSQISFNLGFQMFYLLKDNYLLCFISLFFSSIVLMLAHVFSALMELGYVNRDFFFLFFKCANKTFMWAQCVRLCWVCVLGCVRVFCLHLFLIPFDCGATQFISTCLQNYRSMPELDLWKIIDTKIRCNFSSV